MEALEGVATGEGWEDRIGGGVKVSMADQWTKSRCVESSACTVSEEVCADGSSGGRHRCSVISHCLQNQ